MDSDLECPICLRNIYKGMFVTHCLHFFCLECIEEALKIKKSCPLCRKKLYYRPERRFSKCNQNITSERARLVTRNHSNTLYLMENFENGNRWMESRDSNGCTISSIPLWINSF